MKPIRCFFIIVSLLCVWMLTGTEVSAINTGFSTESLQDEEWETVIENIEICVLTEEPEQISVNCFDVNDSGMVAVGRNGGNHKTICVYNGNGEFQYGYEFETYGSIGVEWDHVNLNIYFVRSDLLVSVNPDGEILDIRKVQNTIENNSYVNHFIHATERTIDGTRYVMRNQMGILNLLAFSYSQIVVIDSTGTENIIYDVNQTQLVKTVIAIVFVLIMISIVAIMLFYEFDKLREKSKKTENNALSYKENDL